MTPRETDPLLSSSSSSVAAADEERPTPNVLDRTMEIKVTSFDESSYPWEGGTTASTTTSPTTVTGYRWCRTLLGAGAVLLLLGMGGGGSAMHHFRSFLQQHATTTAASTATTTSATATAAKDDTNNQTATSGTAASSTTNATTTTKRRRTGPYRLSQLHQGHSFAEQYDFYEGADSLGSAGYNTYTSYERSVELGLIRVVEETTTTTTTTAAATNKKNTNHDTNSETKTNPEVHLESRSTREGPRESIRLEGKTRFDAGLFILNVNHMPTGCGQWPAFWLTDEDAWPDHGEIDILEGVNYQGTAKTALHTSAQCSMYAHVPAYAMSGRWDRATGIPDTFTGTMDFATSIPADNCCNMAPHQWANQGCVAVHERNDTLGEKLNQLGGGIYALQWDPENRVIRSWVFPKTLGIPANLQESIDSAASDDDDDDDDATAVVPDPDAWGLPYGYFAIGESTGCSADHFSNMRIVLNTAFCGTVAGNRFFADCPTEITSRYNVSNDPVLSCNAYIASDPKEMQQAYWRIQGIYVYEREWDTKSAATTSTPTAP